MKYFVFTFLIVSCFSKYIIAQNITIQPYLQDVSPHSIYILWETEFGEQSIVEWGLTEVLGNQSQGISYTSSGTNMVHEVFIDSLERFTQYFYRVKTENAVSNVFSFKTPPFATDYKPFRIVAMSDMQNDNSFPNKFQEVIEEGVLSYFEDTYNGDLNENLALVMIPGDLVNNGNNFESWKNTFFNPAEKLFSQIPVYPVLGNHEVNSEFYFTYFKLPENGTQGYEEHWWYKDYGNVRMIGLNSNGPFNNVDQLDWLDDLLNTTCQADSIDFVFAQLHHPHKSELWTPGESTFTGEVINQLEEFTSACQKPSIHFFGHTHGYSRGQSRDHKHLWINVATAGGAIDNWGEFPNFDYDEFSVSQDEYGFVVIEVINDSFPQFTIKRISRGDQDSVIDNQLSDSLTIRLNSLIVNTPKPIMPINDVVLIPECVTLVADNFDSLHQNVFHSQSHWQVSSIPNNFENPTYESWKNFENWYFDIDTQAEDDLTDETIFGLSGSTTYFWRVRYRDSELNWSGWSDTVSFSTSESIAPPNLLENPGAEDSTSNWIIVEGVFEALESGICDGTTPYKGNKYFAVGGLCEHSEIGRVIQNVNVGAYTDSIATGEFEVNFGGYLSNYSGSDLPEMKLIFLDEDFAEISQTNSINTFSSAWAFVSAVETIPELTQTIQIELKGTRNAGTDNDSYFDNLFLTLGAINPDCNNINTSTSKNSLSHKRLNMWPNPAKDVVSISLPENIREKFVLGLTNQEGLKLPITYQRNKYSLQMNIEWLIPGIYYVWLRGSNGTVYGEQLIIFN